MMVFDFQSVDTKKFRMKLFFGDHKMKSKGTFKYDAVAEPTEWMNHNLIALTLILGYEKC